MFGNEIWTHQFGTSGFDNARDVLTTGSAGVVYVGGSTDGSLLGQSSSGLLDAYLMKLASDD